MYTYDVKENCTRQSKTAKEGFFQDYYDRVDTIVIQKETKLSSPETQGRLEDFEHGGELMEKTLESLVKVIRLSVC